MFYISSSPLHLPSSKTSLQSFISPFFPPNAFSRQLSHTLALRLSPAPSSPPGDSWVFNTDTLAWRRLHWHGTEKPAPKVYAGGTVVALEGSFFLIVAGGSSTSGVMTCARDVWAGEIDELDGSITWVRLPDLPFGIFQHSIAAHGAEIFLFGGHLCAETSEDGKLDFQVLFLFVDVWNGSLTEFMDGCICVCICVCTIIFNTINYFSQDYYSNAVLRLDLEKVFRAMGIIKRRRSA